MDKLKIEATRDSFFCPYWKVTGFSQEELKELRQIDRKQGYIALKNRVVEMLDEHNPNQGTCWHNGYGIYDVVIGSKEDPDAVYVETGSSCD